MSRSNPNDNAPNPAQVWFEWNGEKGVVRYYDKTDKENVDMPSPFQFLLLDELASVRGWHDASESGIYSNEVKDTRSDVLVVKSFKGGTLAEGLYKDIKDRVNTVGGQFVTNLYVAVQDGDEPSDPQWCIASLRLKGAALGAWMEFRKANRGHLYDGAINITGFTEGKKGRITYRMPTFETQPVDQDTNRIAVSLDKEFQQWLKGYLSRRTNERATPPADEDDDPDQTAPSDFSAPLTDEDIPF